MTKPDFYSLYKGVNGKATARASTPEFNPSCINESKFAYDLRFKEVTTDFTEGKNGNVDEVVVDWQSQSWPDDGIDAFIDEVKRCFKHIGFKGLVKVNLYDRDGDNEAYHEIEIA